MPTAVERLLDSFLKFDGIREQALLDDAFVKIDDTLVNLANASADDFLKIKLESDLKGEFNVIGESFIKLGSDFHKIATAGQLIDQFVLKLTPTIGTVDGAPSPQADFVVLDHKIDATSTDLKILGVDFLKIHTATTPDSFTIKLANVSTDFLKIGGDMAADRTAFLKLSEDFLKLGGTNTDNTSPLDLAYKEFGGDLRTVAGQFDLLANDFLKLSQAVQADGSVTVEAGGGGGAGKVGATLALLYQDFFALEASMNTIGGAASQLIGLLSHEHKIDSGPPTVVGDAVTHGGGHG
jgi:hypothetical protein